MSAENQDLRGNIMMELADIPDVYLLPLYSIIRTFRHEVQSLQKTWDNKVAEPRERYSDTKPSILDLAGTIDDNEAKVMEEAIEESRKIDRDEW